LRSWRQEVTPVCIHEKTVWLCPRKFNDEEFARTQARRLKYLSAQPFAAILSFSASTQLRGWLSVNPRLFTMNCAARLANGKTLACSTLSEQPSNKPVTHTCRLRNVVGGIEVGCGKQYRAQEQENPERETGRSLEMVVQAEKHLSCRTPATRADC
jgi:hypothetical protein